MEMHLSRDTAPPPISTLVGRMWLPASDSGPVGGPVGGPAVVAILGDAVLDVTRRFPTVAELLNQEDPVGALCQAAAEGDLVGDFEALLASSALDDRQDDRPYFLAPCDLQALKACGVTFVKSLLERVIEERTKGDPAAADAVRATLTAEIGGDLASVVPGSEQAAKLKLALQARDLWSQYLEVGIGPDAEVFTKSQPMSAVGSGAEIGLNPASTWNNPEPEMVLVVNARAETVGATLGNDVNLRDFEGRSALLLGQSKDNTGSCAIGPFIRLFDDDYGIDAVRQAEVRLSVTGDDGFALEGGSSMSEIGRDPLELVRQACGPTHQYPDGMLLFTGTMYAPIEDRDVPGEGFTHKLGDLVRISNPDLGVLQNRVGSADKIAPWTFGTVALMRNLADRGLLKKGQL